MRSRQRRTVKSRHQRSRIKSHRNTHTQRRNRRRVTRQQSQVISAAESLHSVQHDTSELIIVQGMIDGVRCRDVLIDPGATSNFVRRDWALSNRLRVELLSSPLEVKLANDQTVDRVTGGVAVKSMSAQGSSVPCTLVVMERLSHHVILGMPWLKRAQVTISCGEVMRWNGAVLNRHEEDESAQLHNISIDVAPEHERTMVKLLSKYPKVFCKELPRRSEEALSRAIHCEITLKDPNCRPVVSRARKRSPPDVQTLIDHTREMEAAGLIQKSDSPWSSEAVLVRKMKDGVVLAEKRPCFDYRGPNDLIVSDAHPLPLPEQMFNELLGSAVFSKLDLTKGFWQIPMERKSRKILAMATPLGLYEPLFMPFGMKNAPAVFQREMSRVLQARLHRGVGVFIDDIIIYSKTVEQHEELVEFVLRRLQEEGYYAHPDKCEFFKRSISFLGHIVSEGGVAVQEHKVKAVSEWPEPRTKRHVRQFLGLTGYYRKFIPCYSEIATPLTDLTKDTVKFEWTEREQAAFELLKNKLTVADVLAHPDQSKQYIISTDASGFACAGVLSQDQPDGTRRPIAYMSRKMSDAERRYPTHDKELLAIVQSVEHWRYYLEGSGHPILLLSDHRSLQHLNSQPHLNDRQARWVEKLSDFEFQIQYVKGSLNSVADALSRRADYEDEAEMEREHERTKDLSDEQPRVKLQHQTIATTTAQPLWQIRIHDTPLLSDVQSAAKRDMAYQDMLSRPEPRTDGLIVGDGLLWTSDGLFYVPNDLELRRRLIHEVHDTPTGGHMGLAKTMARLTTTCWWSGMKSMIADYVRGCTTCAAIKPLLQKPAGTLRPLPIPDKPWRTISIDFVGPLPATKDYFNYILVVVDKFSKMAHFIATTTNVTSKETAELLINNIVRLHGLPDAIISDRGHEFTASLFQEVWKAMGTELRMSTAYHPQSDGQTERVNRELEQQLRAHADRTGSNWKEWLAIVEMHYNSDVHSSTGKTPYEMNGVDWRDQWALALRSSTAPLPNDQANDLLRDIRTTWEDARQVMVKQREQQRKYADQQRREERYRVGDQVMLSTEHLAAGKGKLQDRWVGPFPVVEARDNGVNVRLDLPKQYSRIHPVFHIDKLKRFVPSEITWPGREQAKRPRAKLVDGKKQYWAVRLIGKKEEECEVMVREDVNMEEKYDEDNDAGAGGEEEKESSTAAAPRRISPRVHASTRSLEVPVVSKRGRRAPRVVKEKRMVTFYKVEWEGYGLEDATWKPVDELVEEGLQWMIDDYEMAQRQPHDETELAIMSMFTQEFLSNKPRRGQSDASGRA
jgi:hypothetical protein